MVRIRRIIVISILILLINAFFTPSHGLDNTTDSELDGDDDKFVTSRSSADREVDLLKWALKHSDHESLHEKALEYKRSQTKKRPQNTQETADRSARAAELLSVINQQPSEAQLMAEAVQTIKNKSSSFDNKLSALEALTVLCEPIDNADQLLKISGGSAILVDLLGSAPILEAMAARALGIAASNHESFQLEIISRHPDVILRLIQLVTSATDDTVAAALRALGHFLRSDNSQHARKLWSQASGGDTLLNLVKGGKHVSQRSQKRALILAADMVGLADLDDISVINTREFSIALTMLLKKEIEKKDMSLLDIDLIEKAMLAAISIGPEGVDLVERKDMAERLIHRLHQYAKLIVHDANDIELYIQDVVYLIRGWADGGGGGDSRKDEL